MTLVDQSFTADLYVKTSGAGASTAGRPGRQRAGQAPQQAYCRLASHSLSSRNPQQQPATTPPALLRVARQRHRVFLAGAL